MGSRSRLCETPLWKQFVFPSHFTWEAHLPAGPCPRPAPPSGSPAHKGTLSPLNDKQFCDAEAGKRIRQVQGSLENRCVRSAAIWGQVNSWGEYTRNANNRLGRKQVGWGPWGCSMPCPSFPVLPPHTDSSSIRMDHFSQQTGVYGAVAVAQLRNKDTQAQVPNSKLISKKQLRCPTRIKYRKHL